MIVLPPDWIVETTVGAILATNPAGTLSVRYRARVSPLRPVAALVDEALAAVPAFRCEERRPRARRITREGEYAFCVWLSGRWLERPAQRCVAAIYGDDHADVLDAIALDGEPALELVHALVDGTTLGLGTRARRYFYAPPEGWLGRATGWVAHWFPPEYPARHATIVVYPATPSGLDPPAVLASLSAHERARGAMVDLVDQPEPVTTAHGLTGLRWRIRCTPRSGGIVHRELAVLAKGGVSYALQLDVAHREDAAARETFRAVVGSVEPVPPRAPDAARSTFEHYGR